MRVLVTGGSSGIGAALVARLAREGHDVTFTYCRNAAAAAALATTTSATSRRYDFADDASVTELADHIRSGTFDGLVNNAGRPVPRQMLLKTDRAAFMEYQRTTLRGVLELSTAFGEQAKRRDSAGTIVNVLSSVTLGMPPSKMTSYVTSKYALLGLTRCMAVEFLRYRVRVNAVSPSMTRTDFLADLPERFITEMESTLPMGRLATPDEVAGTICFLLSPDSTYLTGANIPVAGGQTC